MANILVHTADESITLTAQAAKRLLEKGDKRIKITRRAPSGFLYISISIDTGQWSLPIISVWIFDSLTLSKMRFETTK